MAVGVHPFPSRTRQLSPFAPTILGWKRPGKIGRRRLFAAPPVYPEGLFFGSLITVGGPIPFSVGFLGLSSCLRNRKTILWTVEFMNKKTEIQIPRTFYKIDKTQNHNRDRHGKTSNFDFWDIWTKGLTSLRISKNQQQHTQYITQLHGYIFNFWICDWLLYIN